MKLDGDLFLTLVALTGICSSNGFTTQPRQSHGLAAVGYENSMSSAFVQNPRSNIRLFAADDDDEDEDDEEEEEGGPLAQGVDSVSWLPTVAGAKGGGISSVKEVRFVNRE